MSQDWQFVDPSEWEATSNEDAGWSFVDESEWEQAPAAVEQEPAPVADPVINPLTSYQAENLQPEPQAAAPAPVATPERMTLKQPAQAQSMEPWEPTLWEKAKELFTNPEVSRARATNEWATAEIAREFGTTPEKVYSAAGGARPMFNPQGKSTLGALTEAGSEIAKQVPFVPEAAVNTVLRVARKDGPEVDQNWLDDAIAATKDGKTTREIFGMPAKEDEDQDPNLEAFASLGESIAYSLSSLVSAVVASAGAAATTGPAAPLTAPAAAFSASAAVAYRGTKDEFLERAFEKENELYTKLHGTGMPQEHWDEARQQYEVAAVKYGAWEAIPEAASNLIFMRAILAPMKGASKEAFGEFAKRAAETMLSEQFTETATAYGQSGAEAEVDMGEQLTIAEAFKQQAIQTAIITTLLGGGGAAANKGYQVAEEKFAPGRALGRAMNETLEQGGGQAPAITPFSVGRNSENPNQPIPQPDRGGMGVTTAVEREKTRLAQQVQDIIEADTVDDAIQLADEALERPYANDELAPDPNVESPVDALTSGKSVAEVVFEALEQQAADGQPLTDNGRPVASTNDPVAPPTQEEVDEAAFPGLIPVKTDEEPPDDEGGATYPIAPRDEWWGDADYEARGGELVEMTPDEFLAQAKGKPLDMNDEMTAESVQDLIDHIQSGRTLDPLALYPDNNTEGTASLTDHDGRHRALAAKALGMKTVPVLNFREQTGSAVSEEQALADGIVSGEGGAFLHTDPGFLGQGGPVNTKTMADGELEEGQFMADVGSFASSGNSTEFRKKYGQDLYMAVKKRLDSGEPVDYAEVKSDAAASAAERAKARDEAFSPEGMAASNAADLERLSQEQADRDAIIAEAGEIKPGIYQDVELGAKFEVLENGSILKIGEDGNVEDGYGRLGVGEADQNGVAFGTWVKNGTVEKIGDSPRTKTMADEQAETSQPEQKLTVFHSGKKGLSSINEGSFFFTDKKNAEVYDRGYGQDDSTVYETEISVSSPLDATTPEGARTLVSIAQGAGVDIKLDEQGRFESAEQIGQYAPSGEGYNQNDLVYIPEVRQALQEAGYDSLKATDMLESTEAEIIIPFASTPLKAPESAPSTERKLTPIPERVNIGLGSIKTKPIGKTLYHETDARRMSELLGDAFSNNAERGSPIGKFLTDNPDLAIGQGDNKGVKVLFNGDLVSGAENVKPGTGDLAGREYQTDFIGRDGIKAFFVPSKQKIKGVGRAFAKKYFDAVEVKGGTLYVNKAYAGADLDGFVDPRPAEEERKAKKAAQGAKLQEQRTKIDRTKDSLLTAIAKKGGLPRDEWVAQGVDPAVFKDKAIMNKVFGRPPFRKEGGMSVDEIGELMVDEGYATEPPTAQEIVDFIIAETNGTPKWHPDAADRLADEAIVEQEEINAAQAEHDVTDYEDLTEGMSVEQEEAFHSAVAYDWREEDSDIPWPDKDGPTGGFPADWDLPNDQYGEITNESQLSGMAETTEPGKGEEGFSLTGETETEREAREAADRAAIEAENRAAAEDASRLDAQENVNAFTLTGSDRPADVLAAAGQQDLLSSGAESTPKSTPESSAPAAPITDFGEKIGGAAKDNRTKLSASVAEEIDVSATPLSKSFPKPNYAKLVEEGLSPEAAAFIAQLRAEIPSKPRAGHKLRRWVETVQSARDTVSRVLSDPEFAANLPAELKKFSEKKADGPQFAKSGVGYTAFVPDVMALANDIPASQIEALGDYKLSNPFYTLFDGKKDVSKWEVKNMKKKGGFGNMGNLAHFDTKEDALAYIKSQVMNAEEKGGARAKTKLDIWTERGKPGAFIGKKVGARKYIQLHHAETVKEARAYRDENMDELLEELERKKKIPNERREVNNDRVGEDYRQGVDVTPEKFSETFGFRGVEFGNWVEQGRRQRDINDAYDGLMDLANLIGVPPKALSLNGQLGLGFGSRGKGGTNPAAAHYESDKVVINLTKKQGAGSLAHEWFHAMDNYFERGRGRGSQFLTQGFGYRAPPVKGEPVRDEVLDAFRDLMRTIQETELPQRSKMLDQRRGKDYWSTPLEMAARSFERFIIDKAAQDGNQSDYLANIVDEQMWAAEEALFQGNENTNTFPYPTTAEAEQTNAAFQRLFDTLQTKVTESGIALFSLESDPLFALEKAAGSILSQASTSPAGKIIAWHGSPHDFTSFDITKIGTGEGSQAYGYGLYFAEAEDVARGYRNRIAGAEWVDGRGVPQQTNSIRSDITERLRAGGMGVIEAEKAADLWTLIVRDGDKAKNAPGYSVISQYLDEKGIKLREKGSLYQVEIDATLDDLLDWDLPLSEQSELVRKALGVNEKDLARYQDLKKSLVELQHGGLDSPEWNAAQSKMRQMREANPLLGAGAGDEVYNIVRGNMHFQDASEDIGKAGASYLLRDKGIKGIKYKDGFSRGAEGGTYNFVIFDDSLISVKAKFALDSSLYTDKATQYTRKQAAEAILPIAREIWNEDINVEILSAEEIPAHIQRQVPDGRYPKGYIVGDTVFLIHDMLADDADAITTFIHEAKGHYGVNALVGDQWAAVATHFRKIKKNNASYKSIMAELNTRYDVGSMDEVSVIKEFIALAAERRITEGSVGRFMRLVREAVAATLDALGIRQQFSMTHIDRMLSKSEQILGEKTVRPEPTQNLQPAFALESPAPAFYSGLSKAASNLKQLKGTPDQMLASLKKQPGAKDAEIEAIDLQEFLDAKKEAGEQVTKDELQAYIDANGVQVDTVEVSPDDIKFSDYTLAGGQNYREILLTLPSKATFKSGHFDQPNVLLHLRVNDRIGPNGEKILFIEELQSDWHQKGRKKGYGQEKRTATAEDVEVKFLESKVPEGESPSNYPGYYEYFEKDTGEMIARGGGSQTEDQATADAVGLLQIKYDEQAKESVPDAPFKANGWVELGLKKALRMAAEGGYDAVSWAPGKVQADRYKLSKQVESISVVPRTNAVTGESSRSVMIGLSRGGNISLGVNNDGVVDNTDAENVDLKGKPLESVVGKDMAEKIMSNDRQTIVGSGLDVGGQGMLSFYDRTMPNILKDVARKLDKKAQLGELVIGESDVYQYEYSGAVVEEEFGTKEEAEAALVEEAISQIEEFDEIEKENITDYEIREWRELADARVFQKEAAVKAQSITITDKMREGAMEGQPLFSLAKKEVDPFSLVNDPEAMARELIKQKFADRDMTAMVEREYEIEDKPGEFVKLQVPGADALQEMIEDDLAPLTKRINNVQMLLDCLKS